MIMKNITNAFSILCAGALLALTFGCSTTKHTENMLSAAGFRIVPANTPERQNRLHSLPADKITMAQRDGQNYFVFPDPAKNVLYVGHEPEYQKYQKLRLEKQLAQEELNTAQMNADWGPWGPWY